MRSRAVRCAAVLSAVLVSSTASAASSSPERHDRLVVRLRAAPQRCELGATGLARFDALCRAAAGARLSPLTPPRTAPRAAAAAFVALGLDRIVRIDVAPGEAGPLLAALSACADVERVDRAGRARAAKVPNDPLWNSQWALQTDKLDMSRAWNLATDATGVPIAVIDSGSDLNHADFRTNRWTNGGEIPANAIDDDGNGYVDDRFGWDFVNVDADPQDDSGHGTAVAGVLGAAGDNTKEISGVCWTAEVMTLKALDATDFGTFDQLAEAVIYAVDAGARVLNLSFETTVDDATLRAAIDYARAADVVQVAAAGNQGSTIANYPAAYDGVLGVIATDSNDQRWTSSSHGAWCDVAAPGVSVLTLKRGGGTAIWSGTSFAAPHVAGLAALVRKLRPELDREGVELTLRFSADDLGVAGFDDQFGWGRVDGRNALEMAMRLRASVARIQDGGMFDLFLDVPATPGDLYFLFAGFSGRLPGIPLDTYETGDARFFPLNPDWLYVFTGTTPSNPFFTGFQGTLDAAGEATATVDLPPRAFEGLPLDFAFVTLDPGDWSHIVHVSGPARVWID